MKAAWGALITGMGASICCVGPVVAVSMGAGALGAAAIKFEPYRPVFLAMTVGLLALAFYRAYTKTPNKCTAGSTCAPASIRGAKLTVWIVTAVILLLVAFPYYIEFLLD